MLKTLFKLLITQSTGGATKDLNVGEGAGHKEKITFGEFPDDTLSFVAIPFFNAQVAILPRRGIKDLKDVFGYLENKEQANQTVNALLAMAGHSHFQLFFRKNDTRLTLDTIYLKEEFVILRTAKVNFDLYTHNEILDLVKHKKTV